MLLLLVLFQIPAVFGQNETVPEENSTMYMDPRCAPGCFFGTNILEQRSIELFPQNCSTVCAPHGLQVDPMTEISEKNLTKLFKSMRHLIGSLYITRTNFKSCSFLDNLESIDCYNSGIFLCELNKEMTEIGLPNLRNVSCNVQVSNGNMTRLNLPNLTPTYSTFSNENEFLIDVDIYDNGPNFCITIQEMSNFMANKNVIIDWLHRINAKYCEWSITEKICDLGNSSLKILDSKCTKLRGDLKILEGDESYVQKLENVETIFGCLIMNGTNLTNANFLGNLKNIMCIKAEQPAILIQNNPFLGNVTFPSLKRYTSPNYVPVQFYNNSLDLLKTSQFCYDIQNNIKMRDIATYIVRFNDKTCDPDCFFNTNLLKNRSTSLFPTHCSTVCTPHGLLINQFTDLSENQLGDILKNMKTLIGTLTVTQTKYKNCSFLKSLESIDCYNIGSFYCVLNKEMKEIGLPNLKNVSCNVQISNENMTRLNLSKLNPGYSENNYTEIVPIDVDIYDNSPEFCFTIQEMSNLMANEYILLDRFRRMNGKYCDVTNSSSSLSDKICEISTLENLESNCSRMLGDVEIGPGDEDYVQKLANVSTIFGCLVINGTNLTNTNFLGKLKNVMCIKDEQPAILIQNNQLLVSATFPSLKRYLSPVNIPFQFYNNSEKLMKTSRYCHAIQTSTKFPDKDPYIIRYSERPRVTFDDKSCAKNCTFLEESLTFENLKLFPTNCSTVCSYLTIDQNSNLTENQLTSIFKNMKTLYGSLKVSETNFTSGKFLAGLETIECGPEGSMTWAENPELLEIGMTNLTRCACDIETDYNIKMTILNLPNLKNFTSQTENVSKTAITLYDAPQFCIRIEEIANFIVNGNVFLKTYPSRFCDSSLSAAGVSDEKFCLFGDLFLRNLSSGCVRVQGDIEVIFGDENHTDKLKTVKWIFGSLKIDSTNLKTIDFLDELEYVAVLDYRYPITITYNNLLQNVTIPKLKRTWSERQPWIQIGRNHPNLTTWILDHSPLCIPRREFDNETEFYITGFEGESCEEMRMQKEEKGNLSGRYLDMVFLVMLYCFNLTFS